MTTKEFSDEFDVMLRSYMLNKNFGTGQSFYEFDEYEKSLLLTQAQLDVVLELYKNYEDDEYTKLQLAPLLSIETITSLNASATTNEKDESKQEVISTSYYTLAKSVLNRYKDNVSYTVNSDGIANKYIHNIIGIVEGKALVRDTNNKCNAVEVNKWTKHILEEQGVENLITNEEMLLGSYKKVYPNRNINDSQIKLLPITSVRLNEINSILKNPFKNTKNRVFMCYTPYITYEDMPTGGVNYIYYSQFVYPTFMEMVYGGNSTDPQSTNTSNKVVSRLQQQPTVAFTPTKTLCDFGLEFISSFEIMIVFLTVLRTPEPIILQDFDELSIDGINTAQTCKLQNSLHRTILKRAVELAIKKIPSSNV